MAKVLVSDRRRKLMRGYALNYYRRNKTKALLSGKRYEDRCLKSWEGFIPVQTQCQICGKTIYFNRKDLNTSIHFDHRHGLLTSIKNKSPNQWLRKHKRTTENESIWRSNDFGTLCRVCNSHLPTNNRKEYVKQVLKYVFGEAK
jgi:5-methylcytosine-specific restriction endonuclease McrA